MDNELPIEVRKQIINNQIAAFRQGIYLDEVSHKINKRLGNTDKCEQLEKELLKLNQEMDGWLAELNSLDKSS